jgi:hypothetical protein
MITACFARALQSCTGRLYMGFRFIFQAVRPIGKTRNQLYQKQESLCSQTIDFPKSKCRIFPPKPNFATKPVGEGDFRERGRYFSTVDLATSMPSFRSSPTMRGDPQVGFACHIMRISSRTSLTMVGRPDLPCWLNRRQWSRNRCRCQAITVRGWTNARAWWQRGHSRESHTQNSRSAGRSRGRGLVCL